MVVVDDGPMVLPDEPAARRDVDLPVGVVMQRQGCDADTALRVIATITIYRGLAVHEAARLVLDMVARQPRPE